MRVKWDEWCGNEETLHVKISGVFPLPENTSVDAIDEGTLVEFTYKGSKRKGKVRRLCQAKVIPAYGGGTVVVFSIVELPSKKWRRGKVLTDPSGRPVLFTPQKVKIIS